jgi:hypothetical protein
MMVKLPGKQKDGLGGCCSAFYMRSQSSGAAVETVALPFE